MKQKLHPDDFFELPNGKKRYFSDLISHRDEIKKNPKKMELFQHIYSVYQKCLPDSKLPPYSLMLDIYGKVIINTQEVSTGKNVSMGSALYLGASAIDHSCMPNTIWVPIIYVFDGNSLSRYLKHCPIEALPSRKCSIKAKYKTFIYVLMKICLQ